MFYLGVILFVLGWCSADSENLLIPIIIMIIENPKISKFKK